ncbi:uncharacterized protein LOC130647234 [Hydractinia symbiolongicarpus]|uniref:uncharacterized protein LOC130647234 n=1 Tax=Hydractinia symbiolongicarpus TaxID=13093 RepID=UPI00254AB363|nr:uncharacterized protein LOC130647234 [Hydractinia symbiolongicarpus]
MESCYYLSGRYTSKFTINHSPKFDDSFCCFIYFINEIKRIFEHTKMPTTYKVSGERILSIIREDPNTIIQSIFPPYNRFHNYDEFPIRDTEPEIEVIDSSRNSQAYFVGSEVMLA